MTLTRRALFKGMGASLLLAPSIVRASSLDYVPREVKEDLVIAYWEYGVTGWFPVITPRHLVPRPYLPIEVGSDYAQAFQRHLDGRLSSCLTACEI